MKIGKLKWTVLSMLFPLLLIACGGNTSNNDTNGSANQSSLEASDSQQSSVGNASSSVHEHTFDSSWSSDAEYHWHASTCGCDGVDGKEKHTFEIEVTEPTFESDGCSTYICTICGYSYTDGIVDKLTHNFSHEWSYDDVSHWHSCLDKGYEDLRSDEAQHNFKDEILTPTYEYAGYTTHTCMECGYSYTDNETDKLEHQYSEEWNYNGNSHWHTCTDDGYENLRSEEAQHSFTDKVTAPTYESSGYTTHTCTVCGYSYKDSSIDKLSHQYSAEWSYDASTHWHSCTDSGYEGLKSDETKHNFTSEVTAPTYVSGGYTTHTCIVCGYSYIDGETKPLIRKYTITWKNWDGTVLEMDTDVEEGTVPSYDGLTPIRPEDETYTYTWEGWSPEVTKTSCNQIYTATFHSEKIKYTVDFDLDDGTSSSYTGTKVVEAFTNDIFFFDVKKEGYNFRGWSYNGEKVFDEKGKLYFTPKMEKKMTFVALFSQTVKMSVTTNMTEAGVVIGQENTHSTAMSTYLQDPIRGIGLSDGIIRGFFYLRHRTISI